MPRKGRGRGWDAGKVIERVVQYGLLMRLDRPIGIYLLLWPTLTALWIAGEGRPGGWIFTVFVLGVILMRSAGCVINDFADRDFDRHVSRTRHRPIATGLVTPKEALVLFAVLCLLAFALVLTLNAKAILMSAVGVALAASYPFVKRYSHLPQIHLGVAFGWAVPMAFAAQTGGVPKVGWLLFIATILWATVYDTMYAMVDREDDIRIGVKSTAILFGDLDRTMIGFLQSLLMLALFIIGRELQLGLAYHLALVVAAALAVYQQYLIRDRDRNGCFRAFLNNNWFGIAVFCGIVLSYADVS
jgi:4-hydroxybenzoate polyprenyltransferase